MLALEFRKNNSATECTRAWIEFHLYHALLWVTRNANYRRFSTKLLGKLKNSLLDVFCGIFCYQETHLRDCSSRILLISI